MTQRSPDQLLNEASTATTIARYWDAIQLYTDILAQTDPHATDENVRQMRLNALEQRSRLLSQLGEQDAALAGYEQYYLEAGSSESAVKALVNIGRQSARLGQYNRGLEALKEALVLAEALNYTAGRADALGATGVLLANLGQMEESLSYYAKSLPLYQQLRDKRGEMRSYNRIGVAHAQMGSIDKAITAFQQCLKLARDLGEQDHAVYALNNLGECYQMLFDLPKALIYHQEGLAVAISTRLRYLEADTSRNLGAELVALDRVEEGLRHLHRALDLAQETGQPDVEWQALYTLALTYMQQEQQEKGCEYALALRRLAEETKTKAALAKALHALGVYEQKQGDLPAAEQMWQQALFLAHETSQRILIWQIHAALAGITANPDLAVVHNRIAAEVINQIAFPIEDSALRAGFLNAPPVRAVLNAV